MEIQSLRIKRKGGKGGGETRPRESGSASPHKGMDTQHKQIRAQLSRMAPKRAVAYILSFELPEDEAACIIECDVRRKSYAQVCDALHLSPEAVNRSRRRAYQKIADGQ